MRVRLLAAAAAVCMLVCTAAFADDKPKDGAKKDDELNLPAFPADKTVKQTVQIGGKTITYDATVGTLPVLDEKGKTIADVMYIAYVVPGANRPVTFALNGGPGASSVYLNFGAIGPKRVQFGAEGNSPSDPATPIDNPGTWLDFTDLVFIDPVGTGFSRARSPRRRGEEALLHHRAGHRVPVAHRLRLAGQERPAAVAQVPRRRELRRIPRPAHHALSCRPAWASR